MGVLGVGQFPFAEVKIHNSMVSCMGVRNEARDVDGWVLVIFIKERGLMGFRRSYLHIRRLRDYVVDLSSKAPIIYVCVRERESRSH